MTFGMHCARIGARCFVLCMHARVQGNITSDHAPAYFYGTREGELGKLEAGPNARFDQIANGMPGLETRMPVLFSKGKDAVCIHVYLLVPTYSYLPVYLPIYIVYAHII